MVKRKKLFDENAAMQAIEQAVAERKPIKPILIKLQSEMETPEQAKWRIAKED